MLGAARAVARLQVSLDKKARRHLFGELAAMVPPVELMFDGPSNLRDFHDNGVRFLRYYQELAGLRPDDAILDVGSGIGRKTIRLTQFLSGAGTYDGIDISRLGVAWCSERITPRHPNFRFQHVDVYNGSYNLQGMIAPDRFRFPFSDASFSFVALGSVFTHLLEPEARHYVGEVARVLRPGERCLTTWFLMRPEARQGRGRLRFAHRREAAYLDRLDAPEAAVAYDEAWVRATFVGAGLTVSKVQYGSWAGTAAEEFQDLVLARKPA